MSGRQRDYKAEYQRRLERGRARGLSRSAARGHARPGELRASDWDKRPRKDPKLEEAIKLMRRGTGIGAAAQSQRVSEKRLRRYIQLLNLGVKEGRSWKIVDRRDRRIPMLSGGLLRHVLVEGHPNAAKAGWAFDLQARFVDTGDRGLLAPLIGEGIYDKSGKFRPFETDPNELYQIFQVEEPKFHEIYQLISQ